MKNQKKPATLLSDECVPEVVNKFLEGCSIVLLRVKDLSLSSAPDEVVFHKAQELNLPILTLDVKFVGQVYRQESYTNGLILLRYKGRVSSNLLENIKRFIEDNGIKNLQNCVIVIDEQKYRIAKRNVG